MRIALVFAIVLFFTVPIGEQCRAADMRVQLLTEDLAPFNYLADATLQGPCVDVVREIVRRTGTQLVQDIRTLPWSRALNMAKTQKNTGLFSTVRSSERESQFQWVGPIFTSQVVLFKRRGSPITASTIEEAKRCRIGVLQDYYEEELLRRNGFPDIYSISGVPEQMLYLLAHDRVDMWIQARASGLFYAARSGKGAQWLEPVVTIDSNELYIAFSLHTDPAIISAWRTALDAMKRDGTYQFILDAFERTLTTQCPPPLPRATDTIHLVGSESPLP